MNDSRFSSPDERKINEKPKSPTVKSLTWKVGLLRLLSRDKKQKKKRLQPKEQSLQERVDPIARGA